jgi:hypothetical protein
LRNADWKKSGKLLLCAFATLREKVFLAKTLEALEGLSRFICCGLALQFAIRIPHVRNRLARKVGVDWHASVKKENPP